MTEFTITVDFSKSEIEFDQRFSNPEAWYQNLFKQKWPDGFIYKNVVIQNTGSVREIYTSSPNANISNH